MSRKIDLLLTRKEYSIGELNELHIHKNPFLQFDAWMKLANQKNIAEPAAMTLSTSDTGGKPSSRIVLLRQVSGSGFIFFTNYHSRKGQELQQNPYASLNFFWHELEKQIRIEGIVQKTDKKTSNMYFKSRPRESQIGAWASMQSKIIKSRAELEQMQSGIIKKFQGRDVPRPAHWGGYLLKPHKIEFWQGRPNRLHDRIVYIKTASGKWKIIRLSP